MAYCTQDDLLALVPEIELAQITAEDGEVPDSGVVAAAIAQADAEIDSYLAVRYRLPLAETPARVKALSCDLALFNLYSRRSVIPEIRKEKYGNAIAWLKDVVAGRAEVEGAGGVEPPGAVTHVQEISSGSRIYSRDKLRGF